MFAQIFENLCCSVTIAVVRSLSKLGSTWILVGEMALAALRCLISEPSEGSVWFWTFVIAA